jgi:hypothetical protein
VHLQSIYIDSWSINGIGPAGGHELRCASCYSKAKASNTAGWVILGIVLILGAIVFFGFILPIWNKMDSHRFP